MEREKNTSIRHIDYGTLLPAWETANMSHVDGVDDGVGYGVYCKRV